MQEATIARLSAASDSSRDVISEFAALTLGSGAAAMVLGRADRHPEGHRVVAAVSRAATEHHKLCVGSNEMMITDLKGLLAAGLDLSENLWSEAATEFGWDEGMDRYFVHQISQVHTEAICAAPGHRPRPGAPHLPDLRQHRTLLGAVHDGGRQRRPRGR